jgi:hypothetical protein
MLGHKHIRVRNTEMFLLRRLGGSQDKCPCFAQQCPSQIIPKVLKILQYWIFNYSNIYSICSSSWFKHWYKRELQPRWYGDHGVLQKNLLLVRMMKRTSQSWKSLRHSGSCLSSVYHSVCFSPSVQSLPFPFLSWRIIGEEFMYFQVSFTKREI